MARHKATKCAIIQANYHLVFIPKYRKPVLTGPLVPRLKEIWKDLSKRNYFDVTIAEIMSDHVHLFIEVKPSISVSSAVQKIKGASGYYLRKEFPEHISQFYWKPVFWASRYFLRSVGDITAQTAVNYIKFQHEHHKHDSISTNDLINKTQRELKTLDNWFNVKIFPNLEKG
jgi:putative transposase